VVSPTNRQPIEDDQPADLPEIPEGYVRINRPRRTEPKKRKASVWWGVAAFVLAIAVAITVIVLVSLPGDPRASAERTADALADSLTKHDFAGVGQLLCTPRELLDSEKDFYGGFGATTVAAKRDNGADRWSFTFRSADNAHDLLVIQLRKNGELWCISAADVCPVLTTDLGGPDDECADRPR
jgi:hypothetical protein